MHICNWYERLITHTQTPTHIYFQNPLFFFFWKVNITWEMKYIFWKIPSCIPEFEKHTHTNCWEWNFVSLHSQQFTQLYLYLIKKENKSNEIKYEMVNYTLNVYFHFIHNSYGAKIESEVSTMENIQLCAEYGPFLSSICGFGSWINKVNFCSGVS